ncbi:conserved hypothetical protein [Ricinus communis]|uniref:RNase H type-1 domain-containing protein n=1 Tax=Ricinus communis TaxID=3988 RepID=B9SFS2_RICCO|nr:conserved hypothetical protein [Ricinus communis]
MADILLNLLTLLLPLRVGKRKIDYGIAFGTRKGLKGFCVFGVAAWRNWNVHNEVVVGLHHEKVPINKNEIWQRVEGIQRIVHFEKNNLKQYSKIEKLLGWIPPPESLFTLNFDGAFSATSRQARASGVIRDYLGR